MLATPDLRAGVQIDAAVGLASDGAADGIDDGQSGMPAALGLVEGTQRIGRLARLAEHEDECSIVERRVAIAELAGVFDLDGQVREPLDQVLADQGRVPARSARGEDDAPRPGGAGGLRGSSPPKLGCRLRAAEPAAAGVDDRIGLLANLLDHVVGVTAQLDRIGLPVDPIDPWRDRSVLEMADLEVIGPSVGRPRRLGGTPRGPYAARSPPGRWPASARPRPSPTTSGLPNRAPITSPGRCGLTTARP